MHSTRSCSHCHAENPVGTTHCRSCGHRADLPRMGCDCPKCRPVDFPPGYLGADDPEYRAVPNDTGMPPGFLDFDWPDA